MNGMLLAAGRGQRMEPLSSVVAKPALEVLGEPLLATALRQLAACCEPLVVNLHRHPRQIAASVREVLLGRRVRFSWEPELLGGSGGLAAARAVVRPRPAPRGQRRHPLPARPGTASLLGRPGRHRAGARPPPRPGSLERGATRSRRARDLHPAGRRPWTGRAFPVHGLPGPGRGCGGGAASAARRDGTGVAPPAGGRPPPGRGAVGLVARGRRPRGLPAVGGLQRTCRRMASSGLRGGPSRQPGPERRRQGLRWSQGAGSGKASSPPAPSWATGARSTVALWPDACGCRTGRRPRASCCFPSVDSPSRPAGRESSQTSVPASSDFSPVFYSERGPEPGHGPRCREPHSRRNNATETPRGMALSLRQVLTQGTGIRPRPRPRPHPRRSRSASRFGNQQPTRIEALVPLPRFFSGGDGWRRPQGPGPWPGPRRRWGPRP